MRSLKDTRKLNRSSEVSLKGLTSFRVGGIARCFFAVGSSTHLKQCLQWCARQDLIVRVLGGGSNLLINDGMILFPVLKLVGSEFKQIRRLPEGICLGASVSVRQALNWMLDKGYSGLEFLAGIPATIGGSIVMNASAFGASLCDYLDSVQVVYRNGEVGNLKKEQLQFGYRHSSFQTPDSGIITSAVFKFPRCPKNNLRSKIAQIIRSRMETQEINVFTAGCIFKNPAPDKSAGMLIEQSGLKGVNRNDAYVSAKHANFIINRGQASCADVAELIWTIKEKVYRDSGLWLEEEVIRWID